MDSNMNYLKEVAFSEFSLWDVKRFIKEGILSSFPIVNLGDFINQRSKKIKLFNFPEKEFGILGVNNKVGIFDAYTEKGEHINQAYKEVELYDIAYNPYRVNVGSIGLKTENQKNSFISPAYVVFECLTGLNSEFLYRMFKTETFNKIINDNTTGSVRQNLKYDTLKNIQIPLPPIAEQDKIVQIYNKKIKIAKSQELQVSQLEQEIENYLFEVLGIEKLIEKESKECFRIVSYKSLEKWGFDHISKSKVKYTKNYPLTQIQNVCKISSGGTPSRSRKEYYDGEIPWIKTGEVLNDIVLDTEEKITEDAIKNSSAKIYPKNSLIIAMYGQGKTRGRTAKLGVPASTNQACAVLYDLDTNIILTDYLWVYLMNEYNRLRELASGNNQPNLNAQMIKSYPLIIPPLNIQKEIIQSFFKLKKEIKELSKKAKLNRKKAILDFGKRIFT